MKKWRKLFEVSLNNLEVERLIEHIIPKLKEIFSMMYQGYRSNAEISTRKLENFEKKGFLMKLVIKYPFTIVFGFLLLISCLRFYSNEKRTITKVLDKSFTI